MNRELLKRALESLCNGRQLIDDWGQYASPYFQEKHNLVGDIEINDGLIAEIETYLAQPKPEPVVQVVEINHSKLIPNAILTCYVAADGQIPKVKDFLYTTPPDQSARIAELELALARANADIESVEDRLIVKNQRLYEYNEKLAALQAKREPLSDDEIRDCAESENLPYFENKEEFDAFARAIEEAHGIGE